MKDTDVRRMMDGRWGRRLTLGILVPAALVLPGCGETPEPQAEPSVAESQPAPDSVLVALYDEGVSYADFIAAADRRVDEWHDRTAIASVSPELLDRVEAIPREFKILAVAEDWCGDSAASLPYVAKLVEEATNLDVRIVDSDVGRDVMDARPTPDGRGATPTFVVLDARGAEVACLVERPANLQEWFLANPDSLGEDDLYAAKYAWYDDDAGVSILSELVALLEVAGTGQGSCALP